MPALSNETYRPHSEFDAGINTSVAWTQHANASSTSLEPLSDSQTDARAIYDFEGKAEFRELTVSAGDLLSIVKEELSDGWSLVKNATGEMGLLPRSYYTVSASDKNLSNL